MRFSFRIPFTTIQLPWIFTLVVGLFFALMYVVENVNGRFWLNDFKVYYSAAEALLGDGQVYGKPFGLDTGYYKYSPFTAMLFIPYTLFSYEVACTLHYIVISISFLLCFGLVYHLIRQYLFREANNKHPLAIFLIGFACIAVHLVRELHLGNINGLLLLFSAASLYALLRGRIKLAAVLFAIVLVTKPYFLLLGLPLLLYRKYTLIGWTALFTVILLLLPVVLTGVSGTVELHEQWLIAMLDHGSYLSSSNTLASVLLLGDKAQYLIILVLATLYTLGLIRHAQQHSWENTLGPASLGITWFAIIALIPNLVITDTEHFLWALPLILLLLKFLFSKQIKVSSEKWSAIWRYLFVPLVILLLVGYSINSTDLLGKALAVHYSEWGVLGISNFLLIVAAIVCFRLATKGVVDGSASH